MAQLFDSGVASKPGAAQGTRRKGIYQLTVHRWAERRGLVGRKCRLNHQKRRGHVVDIHIPQRGVATASVLDAALCAARGGRPRSHPLQGGPPERQTSESFVEANRTKRGSVSVRAFTV